MDWVYFGENYRVIKIFDCIWLSIYLIITWVINPSSAICFQTSVRVVKLQHLMLATCPANWPCRSRASDVTMQRPPDKNIWREQQCMACEATREINTKITAKWAHKQFVTTVSYFISYTTQETNKWRSSHTDSVWAPCLACCLLSDDDATIGCAVHCRTPQLWRKHVKSDITDSLSIGSIRGDMVTIGCVRNIVMSYFRTIHGMWRDSHSYRILSRPITSI